MEEESVQIVRRALPREWVVREYRPDYGIDLSIEIFEASRDGSGEFETMGETVYVQVKSTDVVQRRRIQVYPRYNVEKRPLVEDHSAHRNIDIVPFAIDTSELLTVQAMSAAVPVLLLLVELSTGRIFFVCLNDLIEKVILPADPAYGEGVRKTLYIPARNEISAGEPFSARALALYAVRPKLYAAFEKFSYQAHELEYALDLMESSDVIMLIRHFLAVDLRYDFWTRIPEWLAIDAAFREINGLDAFLSRPAPTPEQIEAYFEDFVPAEYRIRADLEDAHPLLAARARLVWQRLTNLARLYEEVVREWFLPTFFSDLLTEEFEVR